ncbi:alpha-mannosidase [Gracilibacillus timonensis]|uniref:alpha-mannosidase n=1 Tax=Gracilibacillus timonensis TaxID=1816696 RepID=UPI0008246433|nr:alpha-mannosidase [Gracilibacillus timonensis]
MQRIYRLIRQLRELQHIDVITINNWHSKIYIYEEAATYSFIKENKITIGDHLINSGETAFLKATIDLPTIIDGELVGITFKVAGPGGQLSHYEALLSINGEPLQGFDRNRSFYKLPTYLSNETSLEMELELFNPVGIPEDHLRGFNQVASAETDPPPLYLESSKVVKVRKEVQNLLFTVQTACSTLDLLKEEPSRSNVLYRTLSEVADAFRIITDMELMDGAFIEKQDKKVRNVLGSLAGYREGTIKAIGQSHIDVAWLWPLKETIRKASRTFSTASTLLDEYTDFEYAQSQPQLFEFVKKYHPKVFERVKKQVSSGRMEIIGGMWVEPDLNIPSGESLVRQLLFGKKYFQEEFGQKTRVEWLPDTFGYCASLPQLLKKAEIDYFMTTKLNWNDTNRFPYDLFYWEGIDGTSILSYLHTILGQQTTPKDIKETWNNFNQKKVYDERMLVYGYGDGGGGVTREMIESLARSESLPGLPDVKFSKVHDFFDHVKDRGPNLPTWYGDLYLELHRGTYTTHAKMKKYNRLVENLFRTLEVWYSFSYLYLGVAYPKEKINELWKLIMLNQFHDIVPGTAIEPVYQLSRKQYEKVLHEGQELQQQALSQIVSSIHTEGSGKPYVVFNSLGWDRERIFILKGGKELLNKTVVNQKGEPYQADYIKLNDTEFEMQVVISNVPQFGYKTVWLTDSNTNHLVASKTFMKEWETVYYKVLFNDKGFITRLYDKEADREVVETGQLANELQLFDDLPTNWDAWDVDPEFESQQLDVMELIEAKVIYSGTVTDELSFQWKANQSIITQKIIFHHTSKLIDFHTEVDWKEKHKLLKVAFPVNILSAHATYEIPFGTIQRPTHNNTSWEQAQFEVCAQKWADLSEGNYGVSLMNDSKYGYDIKGKNIRLSLLRAPKWPDESADIEKHEFVYSLYPHIGDWRNAHTVRKGHELNTNDSIIQTDKQKGKLPPSHSFISMESKSTILDTIKLAENGKGIIMRLYEAEGSETIMELKLKDKLICYETNLLEKPINDPRKVNDLEMKSKPYEVTTFCVTKNGREINAKFD